MNDVPIIDITVQMMVLIGDIFDDLKDKFGV